MSQFGDDCYYFYNSQCMKGSHCPYRHCEIAKKSTTVCTYWMQRKCSIPCCSYRHSDVINKPILPVRDEMPCFWEGKQGRCTRPNCMYKHLLPRPGEPPLAPPPVVPAQVVPRPRIPNPVPKKTYANIITLVDATAPDHEVTNTAAEPRVQSGSPLPVVTDMSASPPNVQRIPTIKPVIVNTAEDSDVDSPFNSPVKRPVEWKDVEPKRPASNLKDLTPSESEQKTEIKTNSNGQSTEASTSETKTDNNEKVQASEASADTKPTNTVKKSQGTNKTSQQVKSSAVTKPKAAGDNAKPEGTKLTSDKPKAKTIRTKPGSSKSSASGSSQNVKKVRPSADSARRRSVGREQDRGFRRNSKSPGNRPLKEVTGKPKIISLKKSNAVPVAAPKVKSDSEEEDLGIKSLEQTLRERALKSMGIIELKSGRVIRIDKKKRRSTEKKEQVASKKRRSEETRSEKRRHDQEDRRRKEKGVQRPKKVAKPEPEPEESPEEDSEEEETDESPDEESANSEDEKAATDEDDLGEEEEIELGEPDEATNSDNDSSEEEDESKEDTSEGEDEEEVEPEETPVVSGPDKRKAIVIGADRRKAIITNKGSALENFTIKKTVPVTPNKENKEAVEKPKRKRRVILDDEIEVVKTAPVISVVKPSVKNRLGIVLSEPSKPKKPVLASIISTKPPKDVPVATETKPAVQVAKPTKSLNIWSRRSWKGKEDTTGSSGNQTAGEIKSRLGPTSASQSDSDSQVPIKRRMGWRRTGRDETLGSGEEDEAPAQVKSESRKLKRPLQIYVPPALKKVSPAVTEDPPLKVYRGPSHNIREGNEQKSEKRKEPVKTFAQIMAEKRQNRMKMKDSDSADNTQPKKYTPIKFGIEPDELDSSPKRSASATESAISHVTVSSSLSDTNIVKTKTDKKSRWRKKLKTNEVPPQSSVDSPQSSMDNVDSPQPSVNYIDSPQPSVNYTDSPQPSVNNIDNSQQALFDNVDNSPKSSVHYIGSRSLNEQEDVDMSISRSAADSTCDTENSFNMTLDSSVQPALQSVDEVLETLPKETSQEVVSDTEITPAKRTIHSESDSWLDLDVDDLELDVSGGDARDEDLLKEIDELLA